MPETMNHLMRLVWLRDEIATQKRAGKPVEALEACLALGHTLTPKKPAITYAMMTAPDD